LPRKIEILLTQIHDPPISNRIDAAVAHHLILLYFGLPVSFSLKFCNRSLVNRQATARPLLNGLRKPTRQLAHPPILPFNSNNG